MNGFTDATSLPARIDITLAQRRKLTRHVLVVVSFVIPGDAGGVYGNLVAPTPERWLPRGVRP
jgi:hypothetical protein